MHTSHQTQKELSEYFPQIFGFLTSQLESAVHQYIAHQSYMKENVRKMKNTLL